MLRSTLYWTLATLLILLVFVAMGALGVAMIGRGWPFNLIWGGLLAVSGACLLVTGLFFPARLWSNTAPPRSQPVLIAARLAKSLGIALLGGGALYALRGDIYYVLTAFVLALAYVQARSQRPPMGP